MTKKYSTKKALIASILILCLCFSMLVGTTFAWFTDSVTSANNIIKSGNLDVELYYQAEGQTGWTKVTETTNVFKENALWEPGHTEVVKLKIVNEGSLALKYNLGVNVASEVGSVNVNDKAFMLSDFIKFGIVDGAQTYTRDQAIAAVDTTATALKTAYNSGTISLAPAAESIVTMVVYMPTSVGNEANAKKGAATPTINLGINLLATQAVAESDSFGPEYDGDAVFQVFVDTVEEFEYALETATPGTEIVLDGDITFTAPIVIPAPITTYSLRAATVYTVIDLNGNTINTAYNEGSTTNHAYAFTNNGNLLLKNGTVNARGIFNYGNMIVENATINAIDGNGGYAVRNYSGSNFAMNSGKLATTLEDDHKVNNGGYDATTLRVDEGAYAEINGGIIDNICDWTFAIENYGTVVVNDGIIKSVHSTVSNYGTLTVNGGSFTCDGLEGVTAHALVAWDGSTTTINGGTFDGKDNYNGFNIDACKGADVVINGGNFLSVHSGSLYGEGTINVYGGTFFDDPSARVALGYKAEQVDGAWVVSVAIKTVEDLQNAINNAKEGETIYLLQDITSVDGVLISDKNLTIDLGGHTFSVSEGASVSNRNIKIIGSSNVTVKNGTLIASGNTTSGSYGTIRTEGTANVTLENLNLYNYRGGGLNVKAVTGTTVTINNCNIYSQYGGGVEASGGTIVLNDTKIEQKGVYTNGWYSVAMEINSSGKITVNSGEYSGSAIATDSNAAMGNCVAFILSSGGTLNINGGTFNGTVAETAAATNFCGLIYADRAAVVNINGGTFNSNGAILDMRNNAGSQPNPVATISGGTFTADPRVSGLYASNLITVADGYKVTDNGNGKWVVAISDLQTVINNANAGDTIVLNGDVTATSVIMIDKDIVIEGNGYKVSSTANRVFRVITSDVEVTLNNVNMVSNAVRVSNNDIRGISVDGDLTNISLTLNDCSVDFTDASAHDWSYAVNVVGGTGYTVIVNGGVYEGANAINIRGEGQTVVVKNATLTSLYQPSPYENMYGACIYVVQNASSSLEAVGNTFNGGNAVAINAGYTPVVKSDNVDNTTRA